MLRAPADSAGGLRGSRPPLGRGGGGLGGTFAGNPLSCAAALAVLDLFEHEDLLSRADELGDQFQRRAREWQCRWPIIGDVRGLGGMQAIELVRSQDTKVPASEETKKITQYCYEHGLITITAGTYSNVIRVLVPLGITKKKMEEALDVLESAIQSVCSQKGAMAQLV